jgi:hypothetical protein
VKGTIQIASACGIPFVSLINAAIDQLTDTPKIKEIPEKYKKLRDEAQRIRGSPIGLFFAQSERSNL